MTEPNGQVVTTETLAPNVEAAAEALQPPAPKPSSESTRRRGRRAKKASESAPGELTDGQLTALGQLTVEAARMGLSLDDYAEQFLAPLADAYAAFKALQDS